MSKSLSASKDVMKSYLSELLTEPDTSNELLQHCATKKELQKPLAYKEKPSLEKLLKPVGELESPVITDVSGVVDTSLETGSQVVNKIVGENSVDINIEITTGANTDTRTDITSSEVTDAKIGTGIDGKVSDKKQENLEVNSVSAKDKSYRQGDFQAMYFDVAGLIIAVPLIELGGIHKVDKTTSLMGKPDWFKGVMLYRDDKINVVDTALWVMPEKCDEKLKSSLNYQYIIMLNNSNWGLLAENLVDTVVLNQDEVKWLDASNNKRPWLAGLVKEKMCALLDVSALINLLDKGSNIHPEK